MQPHSSIVAVFAHHDRAEAAIGRASHIGLDLRHFSMIGRDCQDDPGSFGFFSDANGVHFWGSRAVYWDSVWKLLAGGMMTAIPSIGPAVIVGQLAAPVFGLMPRGGDGAVMAPAMGALGSALHAIDIAEHSIQHYQRALKADRLLVVARGPAAEMSRARALLQVSGPELVDTHEYDALQAGAGRRPARPITIAA